MIYLRKEDGSYVGPFRSRKSAKRFIQMMQLCGEKWNCTEICEAERAIDPGQTDYTQQQSATKH